MALCMYADSEKIVLYADWTVCFSPFSHILENMSIFQDVRHSNDIISWKYENCFAGLAKMYTL